MNPTREYRVVKYVVVPLLVLLWLPAMAYAGGSDEDPGEVPASFEGTWYTAGVNTPAQGMLEGTTFTLTLGDGVNGIGPMNPFSRVVQIVAKGTLVVDTDGYRFTVEADMVSVQLAADDPARQAEARVNRILELIDFYQPRKVTVTVDETVAPVRMTVSAPFLRDRFFSRLLPAIGLEAIGEGESFTACRDMACP